jgi:hypothetical protein
MKESLIVVRMIASPCVHILRMTMDMVIRRLNCRLIESGPNEVKDTRFVMIDPHGELTHDLLLA